VSRVITPKEALVLSEEADALRREYHKRVLRMWDVSKLRLELC